MDQSSSRWISATPIGPFNWIFFLTDRHQVHTLSLTFAIVATITIGIMTVIKHRGKIDPFPPTISIARTAVSYLPDTPPLATTIIRKRNGPYRLQVRKLWSLRKSIYIRQGMAARCQEISDDLTKVYSGLRYLRPDKTRWLVYRRSIPEAQADLTSKLANLQQQLEDLSDTYTLCKGQLRRQYSLTIKDTIKLEKILSKLEQKFRKAPNAEFWKHLPLSAFRVPSKERSLICYRLLKMKR